MKDNAPLAPKSTTTLFFKPISNPGDTPGLRPDWLKFGEVIGEIQISAMQIDGNSVETKHGDEDALSRS